MPSPKEKYYFYSGTISIEPIQTKIAIPELQNTPKIKQLLPVCGVHRTSTNVFNPNDLKIAVNIPPGHGANVIISFFKQIDKAQFDVFGPKPTQEEEKAGN